jgi:nicotinamidase-related amidase
MAKKHILVLGLKTFGMSIVKQLSKYNCEVLALDKNMDRVEEADEYATEAVQIDTRDTDKMNSLSLDTFDVAIITLENVEEIEVVGCCTDICITNGVLPMMNYFDQKNRRVGVTLYEDAIDTFEIPGVHNRKEYEDAAYLLLKQQGTKVKKLGKVA